MLILFPCKIKADSVLSIATKVAYLIVLLLVLLSSSILWARSRSKASQEKTNKETTIVLFPAWFSLDKLGQGPLSLYSSISKPQIPEMAKEIFLLGTNLRPGMRNRDVEYILSLKSSDEKYKIKHGDKIYLSCDSGVGDRAPVYHFSEQQTPLWIRPVSLDKNKTLLEVGLFVPSKESESFHEEKTQFLLREEYTQPKNGTKPLFLEELEQAKLWGQDIVLTRFAGEAFKDFQDRVKIEIQTKKTTVFCFLGKGDCLQWGSEGWAPVELMQGLTDKPLAQVRSITPRSVEIEVWDDEGFSSFSVKLENQSPQKSSIKPELLPTAVRLRTSKQYSCCFGKKRYLIKEGDWMLKTNRGWKNLRHPQDRQEYFEHRLSGELLIIHSLVKEQGKHFLKGLYIDPMRTQSLPFSVQVLGDTPSKNPARTIRKSSVFNKGGNSSTTYLPSSKQNSHRSKAL